MTTLVINDLMESKELDRKAMGEVFGGAPDTFVALLDNRVRNVTKVFGFGQLNAATLLNTQGILGGDGIVEASVDQDNYQDNTINKSNVVGA